MTAIRAFEYFMNMEKIKEIRAGGGVLFRMNAGKTEVLLIHRRGVWDLPKGKIEQDESREQGACREVKEETGCRDIQICGALGSTKHSYRENGISVIKKTWWYAMSTDRPEFNPQQEEQIDLLEWVTVGEALKRVYYDNLKDVLSRFETVLSRGEL